LQAINQAGCRRDEGFCAKQHGNQKLSGILKGLGPFDVCPVRNSSSALRDYEVRSKIPTATPAEETGSDRLARFRAFVK
jgi:cytochrome c556